jgi:hypothetical protein
MFLSSFQRELQRIGNRRCRINRSGAGMKRSLLNR